ncbi:hypothetical protein EON82_13640 [bacterium]|nr:MAG: hypothetical protein EON82_13640 [bacterium]
MLGFLSLAAQDPTLTGYGPVAASPSLHVGDRAPLRDAQRPISEITASGFTLRYATASPVPSRIELREGDLPRSAFGRPVTGPTRIVDGGGASRWHTLRVTGLKPGRRYFYRIWDPAAEATSTEREWGAGDGWRREFAVATLAPKGRKTIVHLPVKVLLMPNVINLASGVADRAPLPAPMSVAEMQKIRDEYAASARVFWLASGMRLWVDYQIVVDARPQRWGAEPANAPEAYRGLPLSRAYPGQDFAAPGGGTWTFVDMAKPTETHTEPFAEPFPYSAQIEQAFPRRWNSATKKWDFYTSGGGTFGVDQFPRGIPGRSNFFGGNDTAWLATHELHHNLESHGQFSLSNREDDRIVFDHPSPRRRIVRADGTVEEEAWSTAGRHGEHWDVISFWDRQVSDAQWLRLMFGRIVTVEDRDGDGFPDRDPRLPLDEARFGSSSTAWTTDGEMSDLAKAMLTNGTTGPLQFSFTKPELNFPQPNPRKRDSDGDGLNDSVDPAPLVAADPVVVPLTPNLDGEASDWVGVPVLAKMGGNGVSATFQHAHDDSAYYASVEIKGPWRRMDLTFDGEGRGVYSTSSVLAVSLLFDPATKTLTTRPNFAGSPGLKLQSRTVGDVTTVELSLPNRGPSPWYWERGGREIGVALALWDAENRGYAPWDAYKPLYCRLIEPHGKPPIPADVPLSPTEEVPLSRLKAESGWRLENGVYRHSGPDEAALYLDGLNVREFDLWAEIEAQSDGILGGFTKGTQKMSSVGDYVGFVGGYANTVSRLRLFGQERGDEPVHLGPGRHRIQLSRRAGWVWLIVDEKPVVASPDPNPNAVLDRLAVIGGYGGNQRVYRVRLRT